MEGDDSNDESNKSIKKPNWQFMDGADYKGTYRYADDFDQKALAELYNDEDVWYSVIVEKTTGTELDSDTSHKRVAFIVLKNWLSIDKKYHLFPERILNPCESKRPPTWIKPEFFTWNKKMSAEEMHSRYTLVPFPLSYGFKEFTLEGKLVQHFPSFALARQWMEEKWSEFKDLLPSSDSGQQQQQQEKGRGNRKRTAKRQYSPSQTEHSQPKRRPTTTSQTTSADTTKKWSGPIPKPGSHAYEDYLLTTQYVPKKITKHQEDLRKRMRIAKKKVTADQLRFAARLDAEDVVQAAKEDLGVMSQINSPIMDEEEESLFSEDDAAVEDNSSDGADTSTKDISDGEDLSDKDEDCPQQESLPSGSSGSNNRSSKRKLNEDLLCEIVAKKVVDQLATALVNDKKLSDQIATNLIPKLQITLTEVFEKYGKDDLSVSAGYLVGDSLEFGVPVPGTKAAKKLDLFLLRNPNKLKIFRMFILSQCMSRNIPKAIANAMNLIFDKETLGERLCVRDYIRKGDVKLTPNGGKKLKIKELPTLIGNTMTFLAVAILTLIDKEEIKTYADNEKVEALPEFHNESVYKMAEDRMKCCWASKKILLEVEKAVISARDKAHRSNTKKSLRSGRRLGFDSTPGSVDGTEDMMIAAGGAAENDYSTQAVSSNESSSSIKESSSNNQLTTADIEAIFSTPEFAAGMKSGTPEQSTAAATVESKELGFEDY